MKSPLLILFLIAVTGFILSKEQEIDTSYNVVDPSSVDTDQGVKDALDYGVNQILAKALSAGKIPNTNFSVSKVNSIQKQMLEAITYKFDVEISDGRGNTLAVQFVVYYIPWQNSRELKGSYYTVKAINQSTFPAAGSYLNVDPSEVQTNDDLRGALYYGIQQVIDQGYSTAKIPISDYAVTKYTSIQKQYTSRGVNYKFTVELQNSSTITVVANFTVFSPRTGNKSLTAYSYNVAGIKG